MASYQLGSNRPNSHRGGQPHRRRRPPRNNHRRNPNDLQVNKAVAKRESEALRQILEERGCLPSKGEDENSRRVALHTIEQILCQWSSSQQSLKPKSENKWQRPRVSLVTFGSYRLGVHRRESDLDVLALSPPSLSRNDFFSSLVEMLRRDSRVEEVHAIPTAFTPVVKFCLNGLQIDMLFGKLSDASKLLSFQQKTTSPLLSQPADEPRREYHIDDTDFEGMDEAGVRSLNGVRVTQEILNLVSSEMGAFRVTLCAVKEWAIAKGLYSNVLGFLGGVNFAIMVAWVCKRHPNQHPMTLLKIFFRTFAFWKWPSPVSLRYPARIAPKGFPPGMPCWDPNTNHRDSRHLMPILTPAYPTMNSAYNVGIPQLRRIREEMAKASNTLERNELCWREVLQGTDFFYKHSNFFHVTITAKNEEDFLPWYRFCESRLRLLVSALESAEISAWPFGRLFQQTIKMVESGEETQESHFFIGIRFAPGVQNVDLRPYTSDFVHRMNMWEQRREGMDLGFELLRQGNLPQFVFDETQNTGHGNKNNLVESTVEPTTGSHSHTELTPQMTRSRLADVEPDLQSPQKKQRTKD